MNAGDYPELDRIEQAAADHAAALITRSLTLDAILPPGRPYDSECGCCTHRFRAHRAVAGRSLVRRICTHCDDAAGETIEDVLDEHPGDCCLACQEYGYV